MATGADRFAERRQQRVRGAGTHAIVQRGLDFFANLASPLRGARRSDSALEDDSNSQAGLSRNMDIDDSAANSIDASSLVTPRNASRHSSSLAQEPQSVVSVLSAPGSSSFGARRRVTMPASSSPSRNIDPRLLYADFGGEDAEQAATPTRAERSALDDEEDDARDTPVAGPSRLPMTSTMTPSMAQRKQERLRGAGTYAIAPRTANFGAPDVASDASEESDFSEEDVSDGEVGYDNAGAALNLEQRQRERMRGAGRHAVESRQIDFIPLSPSLSASRSLLSDASTSYASPEQQRQASADMEHRRLQRIRGAGNNVIARRSVTFAADTPDAISTDLSADLRQANASASEADDTSMRSRNDLITHDLALRRQERLRGAGNFDIAARDIGFDISVPETDSLVLSPPGGDASTDQDVFEASPMRSSVSRGVDISRQQASTSTPSRVVLRKRPIEDDDEYEDLHEAPNTFAHSFDLMDDDGRASMEPVSDEETSRQNANAANERARQGRFDVQITGKRGRGRPRKHDAKRRPHQLVRQELADQTVVGDADVTMQEERQNILQRVARPLAPWTLSKAAVTPAEVSAMRKELRGTVNLALGKAKADKLRAVKLNDADVLWSAVKKQLSDEGIPWMRNELLPAVLETFTRLSRQSAARAQLIMQLREARKTKIAMRKAVFAKRRHVLMAQRAIDALVTAETQRTERAVAAASMNAFLTELRQAARDNWT